MYKNESPGLKKYAILVLVLLTSTPWALAALGQGHNIRKFVIRIEKEKPL